MKKSLSTHFVQLGFLAAALSFSTAAQAADEALSSFNFFGENNFPATITSNSNATGVTSTTLSLGSGLHFPNNYTDLYAVSPDETATLAAAESGSDYIAVTVNPGAGYQLTLNALNFEIASFGGPTTLTLTDSSENVLGTVVAPESANNGNHAYPGFNEPVTLALTSGSTIGSSTTYRLYLYGSSDNGANNGTPNEIGFNSGSSASTDDSFVLNGNVGTIPEPSTYAMVMLGAGLLAFIGRRRVNFRA